ncbi:MAG: LamG domain-containing protein [Verrucomicrobiota bacterium]
MTSNSFNREAFLNLLFEWVEGEKLSESDRAAFNDALRNHEEARKLYRDHMELHSRLHLDYRGGLAPEAMPGEPAEFTSFDHSQKNGWRTVSAIAAVAAIGLFVASFFTDRAPDEVKAPVENGVAVLSRALSAEWLNTKPIEEGDAISPGMIELASGLVQIEFIEGASVILEGPAKFEIVSPMKAVFHSGRLRAFVPEPAQGFTIEGPSFDAVDLGTEFAMSIDASGQSELHVIDGEVAVHQKGGEEIALLESGRSVQIKSERPEMSEISNAGAAFVDREAMLQMSDQSWEVDYASWKAARSRYASDPDTIAFFDFEDHVPWDRQLRNGKVEGPRGGIVGARWTTGRWPGKGALEFKRVTDRIRLNIEETVDSLTLAGWVRIEGLDRRHNSLFLTDGWEAGEPHWHIGNRGELTFGIRGMETVHSEPLLGPADLGRWLHLAVTYDRVSGTTTHFVNGSPVVSKQSDKEVTVRFGLSEIGNWQPKPGSNAAVRSFNGRFDEFLISRRAYSESEIHELFELGTPYR